MARIIGGLEEKSSQRRKIYDIRQSSPALLAAMGAGGGCVPMVIVWKGNNYEKMA